MDPLIADIQREVVFPGRRTGITWFHPKVGFLPGEPRVAVMLCQQITGSDIFHVAHESVSTDGGRTWSPPRPIEALGRRPLGGGVEEGVCDLVPAYHAPSGKLLALGHTVKYRDGALHAAGDDRWTVWSVRDEAGEWTPWRVLAVHDPRMDSVCTAGCAQRLTLEDGSLLLPASWGPRGRKDRAVGTLVCSFDGDELGLVEAGPELRLPVDRGLLEPTVARHGGRFFLSIRAEDGHGYVTSSEDGLRWHEKKPWAWEDGERLTMSTTQQRWLVHSEALFLVYTRRTEENVHVFRWRAPLFLARVDTDRLCLLRESEGVVFPNRDDARLGNFMPVSYSRDEAWVTVGECLPETWTGDTLLGRIGWARPNAVLS